MQIDKIFENFITNVKKDGVHASIDEIKEATNLMIEIIKQHKDATPEEMIEYVIKDNIDFIEQIKSKYYFPGYTIGAIVGNINIKLLGGNLDDNGRKMDPNALFDIASISKFYTQTIIYNLIKEGKLSFASKIYELDDRFINLKDITIRDITSFTTTFMTNGRINEKTNIEEAYKTLYSVKAIDAQKYNYNDIGMMIMKEVAERITGIPYKDLVDKYIISRYNLKSTFLSVPFEKKHLITGTPNMENVAVNDSNANALGGYSGHAGIFASSDDLLKLGSNLVQGKVIDESMIDDIYLEGSAKGRGKMGNVYVSNPKGVDVSYVDRLEPIRSFALQGSTRVHLNGNKYSVSTLLLNPASMSLEKALENEEKINQIRVLDGKNPLSLVRKFTFDDFGNPKQYNLVDVRQMLPSGKTVEPLLTMNAKMILRLRFLNEFIKEYDKNYNKEISIIKTN